MESFERYLGQVFDKRYRIDRIIGIGGMAVVFEAADLLMNRTVAVKMLKETINNDTQSVKRFLNESKAVSMLSHPNIVNIYDVSVKDSLKYIVMEHIRGITLKNYINRKGALNLREVYSYTEQILLALEHAHAKGIVHRDIKPQNIMLLKNGRIKVADFGIAKLPDAETVTMTDKAIGTVYYISPEQASGKKIDARSDLYSLGVVLYEMTTGKLPFNADSPVSVALMQVNDTAVPPRQLNPEIPQGLEQLILCAMQKDPEKRYQSASQMLTHIRQLREKPDAVLRVPHITSVPSEVVVSGLEKEGVRTDKNGGVKPAKKRRVSRSMFPVILGVICAFLICFLIAGSYVFAQFWKKQEADTPKAIKVENFVGETYSEAFEKSLEEKYYSVTVEEVYSADDEIGTILEQDPAAGEERNVIPGKQLCAVTLKVSMGAQTLELPNLAILEYRQVKLMLDKMGLKVEVEQEYHDSILEGFVISTSPAAGETVTSGDTITLTVSKGQEIKYTTVPNFIGLTKDEAMDRLVENKLSLGKITYAQSEQKAGTVLTQSRPEYASVPENATKIDFTVSGGPNYVPPGSEPPADTTDTADTKASETDA